ncbi:hypothetical protein PQR01_00225 [Paraburkholderia rhynchosiae]|uniref:Uncharacterized protein n=1 Tax=Paraburkholderia rhynchosiae TaxID=487049 RepID=A0ACC7N4A9_9BURK
MQATSTVTDLQRSAQPREASMPVVRASFFDLQGFELMQRVSKAFAASTLVPKEYQGNLSNCMIALNLAERLKADALMVMQNLYIVHGRPGWSAQFLIATFNQCGRFSALRYEFFGTKGKDDWGCRAWAIEKETGEKIVGADIDIALAKKEGWYGKSGSKWQSMPQQMLMYRSAAWLVRAYAPEIAMGLPTADELADVIDVNADGSYTISTEELRGADTATRPAEVVDQSTGEITDQRAQQSDAIVPAYDDLLAQIQKAADVDTLAMVLDSGRDLPQAELVKLQQAYDDKRELLLGA